jgi:hypothetical protein
VRLIRKYLEPGAAVNWIQVSHRSDAVQYAVAGASKIYAANVDQLGRDPLTAEMEATLRDWVVETILQGAYLREYHLWEKDCKAYFSTMAERNGTKLNMKPRSGQSFLDRVIEILALFNVAEPAGMSGIEDMRMKVNVMKHEDGLELDHFITSSDYDDAIATLEGFWRHIESSEEVQYRR